MAEDDTQQNLHPPRLHRRGGGGRAHRDGHRLDGSQPEPRERGRPARARSVVQRHDERRPNPGAFRVAGGSVCGLEGEKLSGTVTTAPAAEWKFQDVYAYPTSTTFGPGETAARATRSASSTHRRVHCSLRPT
jgi:hypothetical protein